MRLAFGHLLVAFKLLALAFRLARRRLHRRVRLPRLTARLTPSLQRNEQMAKRQAQMEAERRVANDKALLRSACIQRYGRPDC